MRQFKNSIFASFLIILFTVYQVNTIMFTHVHYVNGIVVTHSHPNHGEHGHSSAEYSGIACLSTLYSHNSSLVFSPCYSNTVLYKLGVKKTTPLLKGIHLQIPTLRAPPEVIL